MRLATIKSDRAETAGIVLADGVLPIRTLNANTGSVWEETVFGLIVSEQLKPLTEWYNNCSLERCDRAVAGVIPFSEVEYAPLYRNPRHIFGIGLNYADHAKDIGAPPPAGFPGSFFKEPEILVGHGDDILLPRLKEAVRTTAEAELGIVLGKTCRDVAEEDWQDVIAGYTTVLDMTEESILKGSKFLKGDPRYLTIAKNFPTFFSFGPQLVTPDEVPDVLQLEVRSVLNGEVIARNTVSNMTHLPSRLISLHSRIQGWYAGDVLSTGTPRAFAIHEGDEAECRIVGPDNFSMEPLKNPVIDLKLSK
jgi:2-keto-4-pentenoate hydratase/2-oxohepta-3-ene-1,7-dioic acid hydratase in catechol pathway